MDTDDYVNSLSNKDLKQQLELKKVDYKGYYEKSELRKLLKDRLLQEPIIDGKGVEEYVKSLTTKELKDRLKRNVVNTTGYREKSELQALLIKALRDNDKIDKYVKSLKSRELLDELENNDVYHLGYREKSELQELLKKKIMETHQGGTIRIVAFGHTGDGKSSTCNSILMNDDAFETSLSACSVTQKCSHFKANVLGRDLVVVDTPGLFDTRELTLKKTINELGRCLLLANPGPHVFIYVAKIGERFSPEKQHTLKKYIEVFGPSCVNFMIVVFSGKDNLPKKKMEDFIKEAPIELQQLVKDCNGRYLAFNNRLEKSSDENKEQVQRLFKIIDQLIKTNFYRVYTSSLLQQAKRNLREREEAMQREAARQRQQKRRQIEKEEKERVEKEMERERKAMELERKRRERELEEQKLALEVERRRREEERQRLLRLQQEYREIQEQMEIDNLVQKLEALALRMMLEEEMEEKLREQELLHRRQLAEMFGSVESNNDDSDDDSSCTLM